MLIYICDDMEIDRKRLRHSLEQYSRTLASEYAITEVEIETFGHADEMIRTWRRSRMKPDLIFLDIYMQERDGMEAARILRKSGCKAGLIFVTTSDDHAIDSYDVDALYYLKKPYTKERFLAAMDKCRQIFLLNAACFTGSINRKDYSIPYRDILYFEKSGHTVTVHSRAGEPVSFYGSMNDVAEKVKDYPGLLTVGKSYIVNMNYVTRLKDGLLDLSDGTQISVPVRSVKEVESALSAFKEQ